MREVGQPTDLLQPCPTQPDIRSTPPTQAPPLHRKGTSHVRRLQDHHRAVSHQVGGADSADDSFGAGDGVGGCGVQPVSAARRGCADRSPHRLGDGGDVFGAVGGDDAGGRVVRGGAVVLPVPGGGEGDHGLQARHPYSSGGGRRSAFSLARRQKTATSFPTTPTSTPRAPIPRRRGRRRATCRWRRGCSRRWSIRSRATWTRRRSTLCSRVRVSAFRW